MQFYHSDGPSLQKLEQFETCNTPSAGATTRECYKLTASGASLHTDRSKLIDLFVRNLSTRFEDTEHGLIRCTSVANFKLWPEKEEHLEG